MEELANLPFYHSVEIAAERPQASYDGQNGIRRGVDFIGIEIAIGIGIDFSEFSIAIAIPISISMGGMSRERKYPELRP